MARKLLKSPPLMSIIQRASAQSFGKRAAQRMQSLCRGFLSALHAVRLLRLLRKSPEFCAEETGGRDMRR